MNRSAMVIIRANSWVATPTRWSGRSKRSRPSVISTGDVVYVISDVDATSKSSRYP